MSLFIIFGVDLAFKIWLQSTFSLDALTHIPLLIKEGFLAWFEVRG
jgi:hypothetical protein